MDEWKDEWEQVINLRHSIRMLHRSIKYFVCCTTRSPPQKKQALIRSRFHTATSICLHTIFLGTLAVFCRKQAYKPVLCLAGHSGTSIPSLPSILTYCYSSTSGRAAALSKRIITYPRERSRLRSLLCEVEQIGRLLKPQAFIFLSHIRDVITLTQADIERLEPDQLLNDNIIEFYLKYLREEELRDIKDRIYFFNTFFWPKLKKNQMEVLSWTGEEDIFTKRFLFVPINEGYGMNSQKQTTKQNKQNKTKQNTVFIGALWPYATLVRSSIRNSPKHSLMG